MEDERRDTLNGHRVDAMEAKRHTKRVQQRAFRNKVKKQLAFLRTRVKDLEGKLKRLQKNQVTLLPWTEVEKALRHDLIESQQTNAHLCANIRSLHALKYAMTQWLKTVYCTPEKAPSQYPVWYNVWLSEDENSRKTICHWVTLHMYHHTDKVLELAGFHPSKKEPYQNFILDKSKGHVEYVYRDRRIYTSTLDKAVKAFRNLYHTQVENEATSRQEVFDATILNKDYVCSRMCQYNQSLVHREFVNDKRAVFVQHSIQENSTEWTVRHKANWIVLDVIGPNLIMETKLFQKTQVPTEELTAPFVGEDVITFLPSLMNAINQELERSIQYD